MKSALTLLVAGVAALGIVGCQSESYSDSIKYGLRTDPVVLDEKLDDDNARPRMEPDSPGILPLLSFQDLNNPRNPLYANRERIIQAKKLMDPTRVLAESRQFLEEGLVELFGTPANPRVYALNTAQQGMRDVLKVQEEPLRRGSALYRVHCLHCHGVPGDGRGPTGRWINPHPRDYRQGLFKFASVDQTNGQRPPRREDLYRVIHQGIEGTAMPAFGILPTHDLEDLVSYVIHLSLRGKVEYETLRNVFTYDDQEKLWLPRSQDELKDFPVEVYNLALKAWYDSQSQASEIKVSPYPFKDWEGPAGNRKMSEEYKNSIRRGHQMFMGQGADKPGPAQVSLQDAKATNCVSCHTDLGRQAPWKWDQWGTLVKPRDLTHGTFRGGRRPVDIYYRIHSGISGSGMLPFGSPGLLSSPERVWDLVNYVQTLPFPAMRRDAGVDIQ